MHLRTPLSALCLALAASFAAPLHAAAQTTPFALHDGDTVVMYGDSITAQNLYTQYVQLYVATRFPNLHIHFINSGVGGDKVSGGYGGTIDQRLARDVFPFHPAMVTIMLGMNDGGYHENTAATEAAYLTGYTHLLESIKTHLPSAQITLLGPSAYDDVTRPTWLPGGYNGVLQHYADLDRQLAIKFNATFINLNPPVIAVLERANTLDPLLARQLIPDRVHPTTLVHWAMAEAILKGWNAPALISSVTIDAASAKPLETDNASITALTHRNNTLTWTETEAALPLPLSATKNEADALILRLTDITQQLNQEPLRITNLPPGTYNLTIDDTTIGTFTAAALASGINLAEYATPMQQQAQNVAYPVSDSAESRHTDLRRQIDGIDLASSPTIPGTLETLQSREQAQIYNAATPKPHHYQLTPAQP
jgi:lysophospholipase L1-like esterase